ncbi:hypothetical protein WISP_123610 [Willisornis vidua]|uniref:Transmembrane protein 117 n=2 Tax=Passeriformes TaxID=9126 RepID=A0ABQ9CUT2_9PASS|nr:hypothetical protein WISP_123610 [Willisornis vidua]
MMVTDMMLQDKPYPDWGKSARAFWKKGNIRIILFWEKICVAESQLELKLDRNVGDNGKSFFKYINGNKQCRNIIGPLQDEVGHLTNRDREKAFFAPVFNADYRLSRSQCPELEDHDCENNQLPVNPETMQDLLLQLDPYKPMQPDGIHPRILKELADVVAKPLSMIFELSWESKEIPAEWKLENFVLICKEDLGSNRPVSLTSVPGKVMEKIILGAVKKPHKDMVHGGDATSASASVFVQDVNSESPEFNADQKVFLEDGSNPNGDPHKKTAGEPKNATDYTPEEMKTMSKLYRKWHLKLKAYGDEFNLNDMLFEDRSQTYTIVVLRFLKRTVLFTLTSVVVLVITTDWISWDKLNRGFLPSDEVSRAFLASFILVFDLLIVMQDWEFPHFMGDVEVNLPGLPSAHMQFKVPYFQKILKEEYHIHITGKWFNYGIIFLVLILDLNMWKNQIFYKPHEYGQYIGPGQKIYTVKDSESLKDLNRTKLSWEWRSNNTNPLTNRTYAEGDMFLHSRFTGSSLDVKCLAFIPSLLAFALFGFFIWFFGRFQKTDQGMENLDKSYTRMKRKSPSDMGMTRENTQVLEEPLSFQEPHLVSIKSDLSEIVFNSSLLTSENLNAQLNEQDSPLQPVPESSVPKSNPVT